MFTRVAQAVVCLLLSVSSGVWGLGESLTRGEREAVTRYLLSRMLGARHQGDHQGASSIVYPQVRKLGQNVNNELIYTPSPFFRYHINNNTSLSRDSWTMQKNTLMWLTSETYSKDRFCVPWSLVIKYFKPLLAMDDNCAVCEGSIVTGIWISSIICIFEFHHSPLMNILSSHKYFICRTRHCLTQNTMFLPQSPHCQELLGQKLCQSSFPSQVPRPVKSLQMLKVKGLIHCLKALNILVWQYVL